jgi:rubredoxin
MEYRCFNCGYVYDDRIEEISFMDLDEGWICPECNVPKSEFELVEECEESVELKNEEETIKIKKNLIDKFYYE